jgi:hypothetical protein
MGFTAAMKAIRRLFAGEPSAGAGNVIDLKAQRSKAEAAKAALAKDVARKSRETAKRARRAAAVTRRIGR